MRLLVPLMLFLLPTASVAQGKVSYRNVGLPERDGGGTAIEFTLDIPDSLAEERARSAGERRNLDAERAEPGVMIFGKTLPGVCDSDKGVFLERGQRPPTGPCNVTYRVTWKANPAGETTFQVSASSYMQLPGRDVFTGGPVSPRSRQWILVRQLAREIAGDKD